MAAITMTNPRNVTVPGYEVVRAGVATEAIPRGTPVVQGASGYSKAPAGALDFHAVAAQDYYAGEDGCSFIVQGEFDGFTGLVPGTGVYVSATVAGGWDTTAAGTLRARAVSTTRISINCV